MKKLLKNSIFTFILGGLVFGSFGVLATISYQANQIIYNNTPLNEVLDDLYDRTDNEITITDSAYDETLSVISSDNRRQNIELTKGRWIVTFVRSSSWNRNAETNSTANSSYSLVCSNGNTVTTLTGKSYQKSGTSPVNNSYITGRIFENMYIANINNDNDTCYVEYKDNGDLATSAEITTIHAVKVRY